MRIHAHQIALVALLLASCSPERISQFKESVARSTTNAAPDPDTEPAFNEGSNAMTNVNPMPSSLPLGLKVNLPAIDLAQPAEFETATFALG